MYAVTLTTATLVILTALQTPAPGASTRFTSDDLMRALRREGVAVTGHGRAARDAFPFLAPRAIRLSVAGDEVDVFEYATAAAARNEMAHVSPTGSPVGTYQVTWLAPPRFYRKDRVIVLYVGTNPAVVRALDAILGPPFAGLRRPD